MKWQLSLASNARQLQSYFQGVNCHMRNYCPADLITLQKTSARNAIVQTELTRAASASAHLLLNANQHS